MEGDAGATWRVIAAASGSSRNAAWPTQSARVERSSSTPCQGIDGALPAERRMVAILGHQDMGEETRARPAALDRQRRGRCLVMVSHCRQLILDRKWTTTLKCCQATPG